VVLEPSVSRRRSVRPPVHSARPLRTLLGLAGLVRRASLLGGAGRIQTHRSLGLLGIALATGMVFSDLAAMAITLLLAEQPESVNFTAFDCRFQTTCCNRS